MKIGRDKGDTVMSIKRRHPLSRPIFNFRRVGKLAVYNISIDEELRVVLSSDAEERRPIQNINFSKCNHKLVPRTESYIQRENFNAPF